MKAYHSLQVAIAGVMMLAGIAGAADKAKKQDSADKPAPAKVEMFEAIEAGQIEVDFLPKDATQATIVIRNKGDEPLDVQLPAAFGAIHVHGQMGMGGMGGMGGGMGGMGGGMGGMGGMGGGMGGMGGGQGMGGGMGGMGGGMGGMGGMGGGMGGMGGGMGGMGGGMFRVAPDKAAKLKVPTLCLEHGKRDPNPRMKYKIVPIELVNTDPKVGKLCELLGHGRLPQNMAQAAAWNMANGLSWQELAHKNRVESKYTGNIRFFNQRELVTARNLATQITVEYERYIQSQESPGEESTGYSEAEAESADGE